MQHHKYSLTEIENMMPWERDVYVSLLVDFIEKENSLRKKSIDLESQPIRTLSDSIEGDLGITVYLNNDLTYKLNKGDFVVTGAKLGIQIKGLGNGIVTLIYQDSKGEKQVILDRKPLKRGDQNQ